MSDIALRIEIKNRKPVDLLYLTDSFLSLSHEYRKRLYEHGRPFNEETRLYVREIRSGSIITDLINLTPVGMALGVQKIDDIVDFFDTIKTVYGYYSKLIGPKPANDKKSLQNYANIINPVAQDNGSQMNIGTINIDSGATLNIYNIGTDEANIAQNRIYDEISKLETPDIVVRKKVLMYLYQATNGEPTASDKGVIEAISNKPMKLVWENDFKQTVIGVDQNFFNVSFVVDCEVMTVRGVATAYKITKVHDIVK